MVVGSSPVALCLAEVPVLALARQPFPGREQELPDPNLAGRANPVHSAFGVACFGLIDRGTNTGQAAGTSRYGPSGLPKDHPFGSPAKPLANQRLRAGKIAGHVANFRPQLKLLLSGCYP